jgi:hypothetical protein
MNTSQEAKDLAEKIIVCMKYKQLLYPADVLNLMIDCNLISITETEEMIETITKKPLDLRLPNRYIKD